MQPRIDIFKANPAAIKAQLGLTNYVKNTGLELSLRELVKIRVSQLNSCAFCLHMHVRDARAAGETEDRLALVAAWRESPLFTDRERAALAWTEALVRLSETGAPDADFEPLRAHFTEAEMVDLTVAIGEINIWNMLNVGFRTQHPVGNAKAA